MEPMTVEGSVASKLHDRPFLPALSIATPLILLVVVVSADDSGIVFKAAYALICALGFAVGCSYLTHRFQQSEARTIRGPKSRVRLGLGWILLVGSATALLLGLCLWIVPSILGVIFGEPQAILVGMYALLFVPVWLALFGMLQFGLWLLRDRKGEGVEPVADRGAAA